MFTRVNIGAYDLEISSIFSTVIIRIMNNNRMNDVNEKPGASTRM